MKRSCCFSAGDLTKNNGVSMAGNQSSQIQQNPEAVAENVGPHSFTFTLGHEQLVIRQRYEVVSILNDFLMGFWFVVGTVFFLFPNLEKLGIWLFLIGSIQMLIRPVIRLSHRIHLRRLPGSHWDF